MAKKTSVKFIKIPKDMKIIKAEVAQNVIFIKLKARSKK